MSRVALATKSPFLTAVSSSVARALQVLLSAIAFFSWPPGVSIEKHQNASPANENIMTPIRASKTCANASRISCLPSFDTPTRSFVFISSSNETNTMPNMPIKQIKTDVKTSKRLSVVSRQGWKIAVKLKYAITTHVMKMSCARGSDETTPPNATAPFRDIKATPQYQTAGRQRVSMNFHCSRKLTSIHFDGATTAAHTNNP